MKILSRSGKEICSFELKENTLECLKETFQKERKLDVNRQYFTTLPKQGEQKGQPLKDGKLPEGLDIVVFKDLGPQISWRLVFVIEYFGPLISFPVIFLLRNLIWGVERDLSDLQKVAFGLFVLHFIKRELETLFLHKFSRATMPLFNLFKNSGYYSFCGWYIAYYVLHPDYVSPPIERAYYCAPIFIVLMIGNFYTHWILANLRPTGSKERKIPKGFLFEFVSCPNYFLEITQWVVYAWMIQSISGLVFAVMGGGQMLIWALEKHRSYKKEFDGKDGRLKYPNRKVLIPFLF